MADSFFGFDASVSNINDDDGGGGDGSEEEYDALNDETFGNADGFDWEVEHEHLAEQLESSRRHNSSMEDDHSQLEASLSQLVLDEPDSSLHNASNVWRHDVSMAAPVSSLKNVCTVEELERQLRHSQQPQQHHFNQNFFQPRFPPVILQRPPGLQAPVPLPFAPQGQMTHNLNQMNQPINNIMGQNNQMGQLGNQMNQVGNQMNQVGNQMNQVGNQMNQLGQNQMIGNNQLTQNVNQFMQNSNQFQNSNQNQFQNMNQLQQNMQNLNQPIGNQLVQNQLVQNQMVPNGNQFGPNMGQFQHMMNQPPRMIAPPPGLNMPRQNYSPNMGFNPNFRGPPKPNDQPVMNQPNLMMNQPFQQQNIQQQQMKTQSPQIMNQMSQATQVNQISQINQQKSQQNSQQPNMKMQKQRVIYNSNQKNMTSENLVQYIQNTHPILQMQQNNSFHNASHHPMLNNRPLLNPVLNNQFNRHNGGFSNNNRHMMNGDDSSSDSNNDGDSYAGLMSQREKQWLINIQMLQLNTGTPYVDDFYYTVFLERQSRKEKEGVKEAHKANQQNHPFYSGSVKQEQQQHRERHNSARHNSQSEDVTPRTYVPTQFENSLGKLQCGSVTAPRKIIDVEVVQTESGGVTSARTSRAPSVASTTNPAEVPREMRRTKQLLIDIEALYLILLRLEELNDPLAISNALILKEREEKAKLLEQAQKDVENCLAVESNLFLRNIESVQRRPKTDSPKAEISDKRQVVNLTVSQNPTMTAKNLLDENKDDLVNKMFAGLLHEDRLQQFMMVRKGKSLLSRFLVRVPASHSRLRALWSRVLRTLPSASRRDDGSLASLAKPYRLYIQNSSGWAAILESCSLLSEAFDPARTPYSLTSPLTLSCVCALIEKASTLVNTPEATSNERQWTKFLKTFARALKNTTLNVAKPIQPISENKLIYHIKQLESRSTIEILQRGKTTAEFADLSKNDFSEQLIRHLC